LDSLGKHSLEFAKQYVALVEALLGQGVPEKIARAEARMTALILLFQEEADAVGVCPLCGRGEET